MNKQYLVQQGTMSKSGCGDFTETYVFGSLEEARVCFEKNKKDINGWVIPKGHLLRTELCCFGEVIEAYEVDRNGVEI